MLYRLLRVQTFYKGTSNKVVFEKNPCRTT